MASIDDIEEILQRLQSSTGAAGSALDGFRDVVIQVRTSTDEADGLFDDLNVNLGRSNRGMKDSADKLNKFRTGLDQAKSGLASSFQNISDESGTGAKALKGFVDGIGSAVSGLAGALPGMFGNVLGGLATAITGAISAAMGFVSQLSETNKTVAEAGLLFGDTLGSGSGIDELNRMAISASLPMSALTEVVKSSNDSLRLLAGGPASGLRAVTAGFAKLKSANEGQLDGLYRLGYTTEEIISGMADYGAAAKMAGKNLSTDELAEGTEKYLKAQRELTKLTGVEAKDAKAKAEALKSDIAYRRMLQEVGGDNAQTLEKMLSNVNESYQPLVKTLLTGGQITDQNMALLQQALGPEFVDTIRSFGEQARSGVTLDPQVVNDQFASALKKAGDNMDAYMQQYSAATLQTIMNKGGPFAGFLEALGPIYKDIKASGEAAGNTTDNANAVANGAGQIARALPEVEKAALQLRSIMYTVGAGMMSLLAPAVEGLAKFTDEKGGKLQSAIGGFTNTINEVQNILAKPIDPLGERGGFKTEQERMDALNKTLGSTMGNFLGGAGGGGLYERLFDGLTNAVSEGIESGMSKVLGAIGYTTEYQAGKDADAAIARAGITPDIVERPVVRGGPRGQPGAMTLEQQKLKELYDKLDELTDEQLKQKGYKREDGGVFGSDKFIKIPNTSDASTQPGMLGHNAMGGLYDYRPGGRIATIAEAGPEAIMPAKRGADGKLGLEVSGVMLDNSRLLQSLAESSKNQINVMAAVNNKMSEMVSNMEKFARAQEQANRLAV